MNSSARQTAKIRHRPPMAVHPIASGANSDDPAKARVRVAVAEAHQLLLDAMVATLNRVREFEVVGLACASREIVPEIRRACAAVTVLGLHIAGDDGLALVRDLALAVPSCRVVLLATRPTRAFVDRAVAAGVLSVVPTAAKLPHLVDAIRGAASGCVTLDPRLLCQPSSPDCPLNEREREILRLTASAAPIKDIAKELYLSPGTVRNLTSALIRKLNGRNRFDAARIALERGLL
jgi:two-component system response regulator DesR